MSSNTKKHLNPERRRAPRVRVLFSAIMNCKGWRSQMVEVVDLSEAGAKVECRFPVVAGTHVALRIPGPAGRLSLPSIVVNSGLNHGHPTVGLRFDLPPEVRHSLREIVERVEKMRSKSDQPAPRSDTTRVTKRMKRSADPRRRSAGGGAGPSL